MFNVYAREIGDVEPLQTRKGAADLTLGMAAQLKAGNLTKATGKPTHIVMGPASLQEGESFYPVIPVLPTTVFETTAAVPVAESLVGEAVTLGADAASVTATTAAGVFVVDATDGRAGGVVRGHFA